MQFRVGHVILALSLVACGGDGGGAPIDAGDAGLIDAPSGDAGPVDASSVDAGVVDAGPERAPILRRPVALPDDELARAALRLMGAREAGGSGSCHDCHGCTARRCWRRTSRSTFTSAIRGSPRRRYRRSGGRQSGR